jgi:CDP-paratose 2-epimerase
MHSRYVVHAIEEFAANPGPGEVYKLDGGRANSISLLKAIERIEQMTGRKLDWRYVDEARKGDHICYISNLGKSQSHYPNWKSTRGLDAILEDIITSQRAQLWHSNAR